ncbi:hypothetical protein INT46_002555 [Mucor plumbeus]|uniref:ATP-dependent DNA helicase n=1 Tax=Mucor plumbeus TaxID=97098 RepID=A0A8H7QH62_9FUNG|nr:hypothetical protein INT46_002555 [Mucor plumbeus]
MAYNNSMLDIEDILLSQYGSSLRSFSGFSLPNIITRNNPEETSTSRILREQNALNAASRIRANAFDIDSFNSEQRHVYDAIMESVYDNGYESSNYARIFFVDEPGGTGKTYLVNELLNATRSTQSGYALSVASSGTAALLLDGGRTAHSMFKIPLFITSTTICNIKPNSDLPDLIPQTKLIVWDESSMISRSIFEAFDRTFKNIFGKTNAALETVPFGGRLMVFGGDFRQVLPVIPRGSRSDIAQNYDMSLSAEIQQFSDMLLEIRDGRTETLKIHDDSTNSATNTDYIGITNSMLIPGENILCLLSAVYPELFSASNNSLPADSMSFISHTILTPKNNDVTEIHKLLLEKFPGEKSTYLSADVVCDDNQSIMCPPEYLNSIESGSLPPHALALKVGCPIMLLRNLDSTSGLCNGTRLIVKSLMRNVIEATIATGSHIGKVICIPKIKLISSENDSIQFKRCQFPIRLAFAMTINKAQDQTLDGIGLYLPSPVFSHGQLYVALSRAKSAQSIKILLCTNRTSVSKELSKNHTRNVVFTEVFQSPHIQ